MKKIIILRGLPASGKSTFAKQLVKENPGLYKRINRDDLREMFDTYHFSRDNEKFVKRVRDMLIREALRDGKHVIVDDTNLSSKNINRITQLAEEHRKKTGEPVEVTVKEFEVSLAEALERDAKREKRVGERVIRKMHRQFYGDGNSRDPQYSPQDETLPPAIMCDLDGTLAILNGRNPYDGSVCEDDILNQPIYDILKNYHDLGNKVLLLSGRMDSFQPQTERWLAKHNVPYDMLIMRKHTDKRRDSIIKQEIFDEHIKDKYFIRFVLDDRNQVVDMWRQDLGLPCLQVYYGDF